MALGSYLVGLAVLAVILGSCVAGAVIAERRWLALTGAPRAVATGLLTTLAIVVVHLLPGLAGILSRWSVAALALAGVVALALVARGGRRAAVSAGSSSAPGAAEEDHRSLIVAALGVAIVASFLLASFYVYARGAAPPSNLDALSFHLPGVGRWIQTQSVWPVDQFIPGVPTGEYPQNGDLVLLASILPWRSAAFVRLVNYPFLLLLGVAVYAAARELRAPRGSSALVAAAVLAIPAIYVPVTQVVMVDAPLFAAFAAGGLFLLRHRRTGAVSDLVLAGVGLGLALGTKWYGVSAAAIAGFVWASSSLGSAERRKLGKRLAVLASVVLASGGVWMLRNWVEVGNPLYPARVAPLGIGIFSAPPLGILDRADFSIAHYATNATVWRQYLVPGLWGGFGAVGATFAIGAAATFATALRGRRVPSLAVPGPVVGCIAAAGLIALAYVMTPGSASGIEGHATLTEGNSRYGVVAFIAAAPAVAWGIGRVGRWGLLAQVTLLGAIVGGIASHSGGQLPRAAEIGLFMAGLAAVAAFAGRPRRERALATASRRRRYVIATGMIGVVAAGYAAQRAFQDGLYRGVDPTFDGILAATPPHRAVGIAGRWSVSGYAPVWPAFGPHLENSVEYIGRERDGVLRQYRSKAAFQRAVRAGGYDFLIVGRGATPGGYGRYAAWARDFGYSRVGASSRLLLFENPAAPPRAS